MSKGFPITSKSVSGYKDGIFRVVAAVVAAHFIAIFGYEESVFEIMLQLNYWVALFFGFWIALGVVTLVYKATVWLDKRYDWLDALLYRTVLQILMGWISPSLLAFLMAAGYFALFGFNILDSQYMEIDFPVIVLLILLLNVYYLCYYFYLRWKVQATLPGSKHAKSVYIVHTPVRSIPIRAENICYVYIQNGSTFLRTFEMPSSQDAYTIPETLKEMETILDGRQFFRINRQMLVSTLAVVSFASGKGQGLELNIHPPLQDHPGQQMSDEQKRLLSVSEERVALFRKWMDR